MALSHDQVLDFMYSAIDGLAFSDRAVEPMLTGHNYLFSLGAVVKGDMNRDQLTTGLLTWISQRMLT